MHKREIRTSRKILDGRLGKPCGRTGHPEDCAASRVASDPTYEPLGATRIEMGRDLIASRSSDVCGRYTNGTAKRHTRNLALLTCFRSVGCPPLKSITFLCLLSI